MITLSVVFFINSFRMKYKSFPFKYCPHVEIIAVDMVAGQVQDYYNIGFSRKRKPRLSGIIQ